MEQRARLHEHVNVAISPRSKADFVPLAPALRERHELVGRRKGEHDRRQQREDEYVWTIRSWVNMGIQLEEGVVAAVDGEIAHGADGKQAARRDARGDSAQPRRHRGLIKLVAVAPRWHVQLATFNEVGPLQPTGHAQIIDNIIECALDCASI